MRLTPNGKDIKKEIDESLAIANANPNRSSFK
jgi:hypothetical protein